jgi:hypothetical protein
LTNPHGLNVNAAPEGKVNPNGHSRENRPSRAIPVIGLLGCLTLPLTSVLVAAGAAIYAGRRFGNSTLPPNSR